MTMTMAMTIPIAIYTGWSVCAEGRRGLHRGGSAQMLQSLGGGLVLRVEASLPIVAASAAGVLARALSVFISVSSKDVVEVDHL